MIEKRSYFNPLEFINEIKGSDFESITFHMNTSAMCAGKAKPSGGDVDPSRIPEGCEKFAPCNEESIYKKYIIESFDKKYPNNNDIEKISSIYNAWNYKAKSFYKTRRENAADLYDELTKLVCLKNGIENKSAFEKCGVCNPDEKYRKIGDTLCKCKPLE